MTRLLSVMAIDALKDPHLRTIALESVSHALNDIGSLSATWAPDGSDEVCRRGNSPERDLNSWDHDALPLPYRRERSRSLSHRRLGQSRGR